MPIIPLISNSFVVLQSAITYPNRLLFHFVISSAVTGLSGRIQTSLCGERLQVACNLYLWAFSSFVFKKSAGLLFKGSEVKKKKKASIHYFSSAGTWLWSHHSELVCTGFVYKRCNSWNKTGWDAGPDCTIQLTALTELFVVKSLLTH